MRCFEHQEVQAVAVCKACNKGLCPDCAVDLAHGVTCAGDCETEARLTHRQILQNRKSMSTGRRSIYLWPLIFIFMGGSMLVNELMHRGPVLSWGTVFGAGITLFAVYMFFIYRKWGQDMDESGAQD